MANVVALLLCADRHRPRKLQKTAGLNKRMTSLQHDYAAFRKDPRNRLWAGRGTRKAEIRAPAYD
jgi:hypothetical protein